ncbi:hypothetical protein D3C83_150670 [compost metagenome]
MYVFGTASSLLSAILKPNLASDKSMRKGWSSLLGWWTCTFISVSRARSGKKP